jgi:hypothetical protein
MGPAQTARLIDELSDPWGWFLGLSWQTHVAVLTIAFLWLGFIFWRIGVLLHTPRITSSTVSRPPGWLARRRARRGVRHPKKGGVGIGYTSAVGSACLTWPEFKLGGLCFGAPGSGKTTFLQLIVQAAAAMGSATVIVDPKGSRELRKTVASLGGVVWTIGGPEKWAPLEDDPEVMAEQLMEGEQVDPRAPRVFNQGARLAAQQLGRVLMVSREKPDIVRVVDLLRSGKWSEMVKTKLGREYVPLTDVERDGVQTFAAGLAGLLLGPAGRSLGSGTDCFRLRDTVAKRRIVLFSLDAGTFPDTSRRIAGWAFLGVRALLSERLDQVDAPPCLVAVDEAHRVGWTGRLAVDLLATGREAGVPVVLASQGPSDLDELGHHLLERSVQDAAWTLMFRQGTLDSARASRILGVRPDVEQTYRSDGQRSSRRVEAWGQANAGAGERANVAPSALENLQPGTAWLRVPPIERKQARVQCVRVALPQALPVAEIRSSLEPGTVTETSEGKTETTVGIPTAGPSESPLPRDGSKAAALERVLSMVQVGEEDECWPIVFPGGVKGTDDDGYPRIKVGGRYVRTYKLVYEAEHGEQENGETVDHVCHDKMCHNGRHLEGVSREENTRRRHEWQRRRAIERANAARRDAATAEAGGRPDGGAG